MAINRKKDLMMISLDRGIELYLTTMETEGKSPRYVGWLKTRLRFFNNFIKENFGDDFKLQDLTVNDGRDYIRSLMERDTKYEDHPMHKVQKGKLKPQYIHGCGRAIRSFSTWAYDEGFLDENIMRRLKLPKLPKKLPEPLTEAEIERVLSVCLEDTREQLRNFSIMMLFLDTGIRLDELVNLQLSKFDMALGEMTIFGKGAKERKVPVGFQAKKALLDYLTKERPKPKNPQDEDFVFLNVDGYPLTTNTSELRCLLSHTPTIFLYPKSY